MSGFRVEHDDTPEGATALHNQVKTTLFAIEHGAVVPVHGTKLALSNFFYKLAEQLANEHNGDNQRIRTIVLHSRYDDAEEASIPF